MDRKVSPLGKEFLNAIHDSALSWDGVAFRAPIVVTPPIAHSHELNGRSTAAAIPFVSKHYVTEREVIRRDIQQLIRLPQEFKSFGGSLANTLDPDMSSCIPEAIRHPFVEPGTMPSKHVWSE